MIPSSRMLRSSPPKSVTIPPFNLSRPGTAAIAASFRGMRETSASGRSSALLISAPPSQNAIEALIATSSQRFFQRHRKSLRQKPRRSLRRNDHVVFAPHPEFAGNINPRLIRKGHAWLKHRLASAHQIRMLVAVESDAVAQSMREILVVRSIAGVGDHLARSVIHRAGQPPGTRRIERRILRFAHDFVSARHFFWRLAKTSCARNVGLVTIYRAAAVDQHYVALFQFLRLNRAVRQRRGCAQ